MSPNLQALRSPAAERAILSAIAADPRGQLDELAAVVEPTDFSDTRHGLIFATCLELQDSASEPTIREALRQAGKLDSIGGASFLNEVIGPIPDFLAVRKLAQDVRSLADRRRAVSALCRASEALCSGEKDTQEVVQAAVDALSVTAANPNGEPTTRMIDAIAHDGFAALERRRKSDSPITGIATGFAQLDKVTGGTQIGALQVKAARTRVGKTQFEINSTLKALSANPSLRACYFSLEMSSEMLFPRFLAAFTGVSAYRIRTGQFISSSDELLLQDAHKWFHFNRDRLMINDRLRDVNAICAEIRRLAKRGVRLVIVDYLQIVSGGKGRDRHVIVGDVAMRMLDVARETGVSVVGLAQLNREGAKNERPRLENLREADDLAHTARTVILLDRGHLRGWKQRPCNLWLSIAKAGEGEERDLQFHFNLETQQITEGDCFPGCRGYAIAEEDYE
jgi:replicative DNA helicase